MKGRELVRAAMKCEAVERAPWVPFVGCHAAALIDVKASEYLKSADLMVRGLNKAVELYRPDGIPVVFDLQLEAEVLGCDLVWADMNPPSVASHPLALGKSLADLRVPKADQGRIPAVLDAARRLRKQHPDVALYGLLTGPFTLAMHLAGTDIFMRMYDNPAEVMALMTFCRDVCVAMTGYFAEAGCDVIAVVDPMTSQIGPEQFKEFVLPFMLPVFEHVRGRGLLSSFFVCGHAQQNIEVMADCKPDNISVDENIPLDYVRDICLKRGVSFGGNMQLTVVLLLGTPEDAQRDALGCMETGGLKGFILAPGCDLPFGTPPANLQAVAELVFNPYQRDVIKTLARTPPSRDLLNLSEYGLADKVIVDIVTLDSEACAPCQYMVEAVKKVMPEFTGIVEWREHKIKHQESLQFMTSLMVKNVPTICIDGQITFVSRIPPKEELIAAIQKRINQKLSVKIHHRKATFYVLGRTEDECRPLKTRLAQAIKELGSEIPISVVMDEKRILSYGVTRTPAVVLARYTLKAEGAIPDILVIKEWIKDLI